LQGNVFVGASLVSLSFSGTLHVLDASSPTPVRALVGHQNPVTALAVAAPNADTIVSGDSAGRVLATGLSGGAAGEVKAVEGQGHKGLVVDVVQTQEGGFLSTSYDDIVRGLSKEAFSSASLSTSSQPKALASAAPSSSALLLAMSSSASLLSSSVSSLSSTTDLALPSSSSSASLLAAALSPSGDFAALSTDDAKVHLFDGAGAFQRTLELRANATALAFGTGKSGAPVVAVGLQTGKIPLYDPASGELVQNRWADISARVTCLAFEGKKLAAASLDESVRVYDVDAPSATLSLKNLCVPLSLSAPALPLEKEMPS